MAVIPLQIGESDEPLVVSAGVAMHKLYVSRSRLYELINSGELESYTQGRARRITVRSINAYVERRLAAEAARREARKQIPA